MLLRGAIYDAFIKHDPRDRLFSLDGETAAQNVRFHFAGDWPLRVRTTIFALQLLTYGWRNRPALIITTHLNFAVVAYWLNLIFGVPYWIIAHGIEAWSIQNSHLSKALRHADKILAVSTYTRERLANEIQVPSSAIGILYNTFDEKRFQIGPKPAYLLKRYGLAFEQPVILSVARLSKTEQYKGYDRILRALPGIREKIPSVHYIIAGKGDDQGRIESLVEELGLRNQVTLVGFVAENELCDHYNLCDLFALPSKGEGFGIVYLEALACGKPTLGGNQDGALDALCFGELGVLVDPDNIDEIGKAIVRILQHTYPHPLLFCPEILRQKAIDAFGFDRFQSTLAGYLQKQLQLSNSAS